MSVGEFFRKLFARPTHVGGHSGEDAAALHAEYDTPDEGEEYLEQSEPLSGGAAYPGISGSEATETAEEDLASEEAPPDPDP